MDVPEVTRKSRVAKVSSCNLPQELELAHLVQDITNPHPSWKSSTPACEWAYLKCNERGEVSELIWKKSFKLDSNPSIYTYKRIFIDGMEPKAENAFLGLGKIEGALHLAYLPRTLQLLDVSYQVKGLTGEVPWNYLPSNLEIFSLNSNKFSGSVDLTSLPPKMRRLGISRNKFNGDVSLSTLPAGLVDLYLDSNLFTGTLDLTSLPNSLKTLRLKFNMFSGVVDLTHLPASLKDLSLTSNSELRGMGKRSELPMFTYVDYTQIVVTE